MPRLLPTTLAVLLAAATTACGKSEEPTNAGQPGASSTPAPASGAAPASAPAEAGAVAKIAFQTGERSVTAAELTAFADQQRAAKEPVRWPETFDQYVGYLLLADEATRHDMKEPANDVERGQAWAKQDILPAAEQSVTDADMQAAFTERRSAVRVMFKTEDEAKEMRTSLVDALAKATDINEKIKIFKTRGGRVQGRGRDDEQLAPQGVLFDATGKGDNGQGVVPAKIAETAFKLEKDGDVSDPVQMAPNRFVLVMRTGIRPGTPLESVPPEVRDRTKAGLATTRAMTAMKERVARLRRESPVVILDEVGAAKALGLDEAALRNAKMRRVPFDMRKMRNDSLRGGPRERMPGVERKDVPNPDKATTDKVQQGMQP